MKRIINSIAVAILLGIAALTGCTKDSPVNSENTTFPEILSLSADKPVIKFGGDDPTIITCNAKGGELIYKWEVDLGDIFSMKEDNSVVRFTGSPCCIGKKVIKCTVTNDKGSTTSTIEIIIEK